MIKISTIKEIMGNDELRAKLEQIETEEQFKKLCEKYDFSEISEATENKELTKEQLDNITGGANKSSGWRWLEQMLNKKKKSSFGSGSGGGGFR